MKKDNSTFKRKSLLRQAMLNEMDATPVIMETHGGNGRLFQSCYSNIKAGVVFEKDPRKTSVLGKQRPTWAVYEADCIQAISDGVGAHLKVNILDVDPYGAPWPAIGAFFESDRGRADKVWVVVNDGLRQKARMGGSWITETLAEVVLKYGNDIWPIYLDVCQEMMQIQAAKAGYELLRFGGYYCGHAKQMTHYLAVMQKP